MGADRELVKQEILRIFESQIKGRKADTTGSTQSHDGKEGDWLTRQMGLVSNGINEPDFKGFEMKKDATKTSFGDWSPDYAIYKRPNPKMTRLEFLKYFGRRSIVEKNGVNIERFAWSGRVFPTVKGVNDVGQIMQVLQDDSVTIKYFFAKDKRSEKNSILPSEFRTEGLELASWSKEKLKTNLERKFNKLGWFKCIQDKNGVYTDVQFGLPINFDTFIQFVRTGDIFCDCGMRSDSQKPYMNWRANKAIWNLLAE